MVSPAKKEEIDRFDHWLAADLAAEHFYTVFIATFADFDEISRIFTDVLENAELHCDSRKCCRSSPDNRFLLRRA